MFLDENNNVKLGDFGLSKALAQASFANTYVGVRACLLSFVPSPRSSFVRLVLLLSLVCPGDTALRLTTLWSSSFHLPAPFHAHNPRDADPSDSFRLVFDTNHSFRSSIRP